MSMLGHVLSGKVIFIHSDQLNKKCQSRVILSSSQSLLLESFKKDMETLNPEFSLYGSQKKVVPGLVEKKGVIILIIPQNEPVIVWMKIIRS